MDQDRIRAARAVAAMDQLFPAILDYNEEALEAARASFAQMFLEASREEMLYALIALRTKAESVLKGKKPDWLG